jgi:hypothetical protein
MRDISPEGEKISAVEINFTRVSEISSLPVLEDVKVVNKVTCTKPVI